MKSTVFTVKRCHIYKLLHLLWENTLTPNEVPQIMVGKSLQNKQFVLEPDINNYGFYLPRMTGKLIWPLWEDSKVKTVVSQIFLKKRRMDNKKRVKKEKKQKAINQHNPQNQKKK